MRHIVSSTRMARAVLCIAVLTFGMSLTPLVNPSSGVMARQLRDVTTSSVAYHVHLSYVFGTMAGRTLDGGLSGTLDSTGLLTATLMATNGMTATVMGTLGSSTQLTIAGKTLKGTLGGSPTKSVGQYGGLLVDDTNSPLASWVLTPEPSSSSFTFAGIIRSGKMRGTVLSGTLSLNVAKSGWFDGNLALDNGTIIPADGQMLYGNIMVKLYMPNGGTLIGIAPQSIVNDTGLPQVNYTGTFIGPGTGDHGTFNASKN